jgi:hypothetical protein
MLSVRIPPPSEINAPYCASLLRHCENGLSLAGRSAEKDELRRVSAAVEQVRLAKPEFRFGRMAVIAVCQI